ncbi:neural cell adhesion molecule 1a isoform X1 [Trichomycterus rosablanca]|uniref:neural cell adhesion molecule 1a isoform X1 n=1 Tax=Trichomycterus rosablanca TaxID=2290929 RepID=UPI002F350AF0
MLQIRILICTVLLLPHAASLQVEITPAYGEISVGESKFFSCNVIGDVTGIEWFTPNGDKVQENRQDVTVSNNDNSESTLIIYSATVDNAGIYKCVARYKDKEAQATVNINIYQKLTFVNAPSPQEFNEGDDADIVCDIVSSPPPTVNWKYNNIKIQPEKDVRFEVPGNNHLQIHGIKKTDEGNYTCEGRIMARGEIALRIIKVVVNVLPSIRTRHTELNATADIGQAVTLACYADGFPEPTVTWLRNNVVLMADEKYSLNDDGSELTIKDVTKVDEEDYTCIARNKAGEKQKEISLKVFVQPKITFLENRTASELEEQAVLTCEATGDPTPSIVWSFGRRVFSEGEQSLDSNVVVRSDARISSLTLKHVQFTYAGQYLCTARNPIGQDIQSMYLEVRYAPKIQGTVSVFTWEGNAANLSCEVLAHPSASVVWTREGQQLPALNATNVKIYNTPIASYLEVTPESQSDFGAYNCSATNAIGSDSKEFVLIPADVPSAPVIDRVVPYPSTAMVEFDEPEANGGVPVLKYKVEWRRENQDWTSKVYEAEEGQTYITIVGLKPETKYEVRMSAINGKGEGESCATESFQTQPVREPNPPKLEARQESIGNKLRINWIKQDDGGSPIKQYLVRFRPKHRSDWMQEMSLPNGSEFVVLRGLEWNTEYEVHVVAENQQGRSQPGVLSFRTSEEPTVTPDLVASDSGLGTGAIVGILLVVFILLLICVDVTCYCLNKCGLLMCIAVNFCGKAGPATKAKDIEEGKAAFSKDESKEPIVEVRTEEECTSNHEGGAPTEPNETTPLTDPEHAADTTATVVDLLPSLTTNSEQVTDSPASKSTTLNSSTTPGLEPNAPKASTTSPTSTPADTPLVDLSDGLSSKVSQPSGTPNSVPPSSNPKAPAAKNTTDGVQNPAVQVDGKTLASDADQVKNAVDSNSTSAPVNRDNGKIVEDGKIKAPETEVKTPVAEVKAVPNEAPQTNSNESKA